MGAIALYCFTQDILVPSAPLWVRYNFYVKLTQRREILLGKRFGGIE